MGFTAGGDGGDSSGAGAGTTRGGSVDDRVVSVLREGELAAVWRHRSCLVSLQRATRACADGGDEAARRVAGGDDRGVAQMNGRGDTELLMLEGEAGS